jgi:hypothetical protein
MLPRIVWNALLVLPAALSAALVVSNSAIAADMQAAAESTETSVAELPVAPEASLAAAPDQPVVVTAEALPVVEPIQLAQVSAESAPTVQPASAAAETSLQQIMQYSSEGNSQDQVTSISQLSDVQPTDWAFQALQSLVERYGCIAGYPDGTYRGSRAMTRYEFAAGMNACLDRVNELIAAGLADVVTRDDLATLQRLQEEFAAELATLRGRVDALEARTAELEANQFSTTTVLRGRTIFSLADAFGGEGYLDEENSNTVFQSRVRLNFDTSFTGSDRLRARLQWGNFNAFPTVSSSDATATGLFADQNALSYASNSSGNVQLNRLEYYFPLTDAATVYIEGRGGNINDIVSSVSSFDDPEQGSLSYFGYNPIYDLPASIGAGLTYDLARNFQLGGGYLSTDGSDPTSGNGLFNGGYTAFGQLTYGLDQGPLVLALTYANTYTSDSDPNSRLITNAYGVSAQFNISDSFFIGGWVSYYDVDSLEGGIDREIWTYAGTLGVSDLLVEGSLLGLIVGVPPRTSQASTSGFDLGREDAALHIESFYRLPLTNNISITPGVIWVLDPSNSNSDDVDDFVIGAIRTSFSF